MDDLELLIPILVILVIGGLIALRILKPFGNRLLDLMEQIHRDRQASLRDDAQIERLRERMDLLAERQEFLEAVLAGREETGAVAERGAAPPTAERRGLGSVGASGGD